MQRLLLVTVLALGAGAAQADDGLFYVGAGISRNKLSQITNGGFSFSDISHTSWKAFVGVRPISLFAVEADYLDLGSGSRTFIAPGVGTCVVGQPNCAASTSRSDAKAFAAFAVGFLPVPMPFLDIYAKAGVSRWKLNGSRNSPPAALCCFFAFSTQGTAFAWGAGAQVHVGNVGARLEYENFNIPNTNGAQVISLDVILRL
jgi:opacity protein-like surface antigen